MSAQSLPQPPRSEAPGSHKYPDFARVALRNTQIWRQVTFPAGLRGVIVDRYPDGKYGVELSVPEEVVLIVSESDLTLTH